MTRDFVTVDMGKLESDIWVFIFIHFFPTLSGTLLPGTARLNN